ncbi:unnamed protein product [Heligmosomoides polygyrus]|uniref:Transmembrane protein n=1 Tax=Heligmosomoides polygyrus TaxID=6339 RepID=A0A183GSJ0_HELPZ|nr:unnamed protein product [Heligmosomoides polygyrus]
MALLESLKWWTSVVGWLAALASWFQIIVVLGLGREEILDHQRNFFLFIGLWIIITCSYFNAVRVVFIHLFTSNSVDRYVYEAS